MLRARSSFVLAAACLLAAPLAFAADAAAPPSKEARVDALFAEADRSDTPGCALGIFQDGRIAYSKGYGMANLELGVANTPHTVYDIGSLGKQFTAFSIYLLARDGKISIDDDVRKYVPELPDFGKPVTIRHLLHHTGGLRDYIELLELEGHGSEDLTTAQEALDTLTRQKAPLFAPGERYEYSNTGYFLLSWVVKRASGKSLRDFAQERIFGPLGMTHTQYNDEHGRIIPNRSTGYNPARRRLFDRNVRLRAERRRRRHHLDRGPASSGTATSTTPSSATSASSNRWRRRASSTTASRSTTPRASASAPIAGCGRSATRAPGPGIARSSTDSRIRSSRSPASATTPASIACSACGRSRTSISRTA